MSGFENYATAVPKVIDFGIAKATEGRLTDKTLVTQFEALLGTPAYMSPEQAVMTSLDIDTRSDIYSLGVLLYELLVGSTPFDGQELLASGLDAMRKTIREKEPVRPSTRLATLGADQLTTTAKRRSADTAKLLHQLKGDLDWIVIKCLEKDRTRRYETANGLAADLRRHLNDEPIVARPPTAAYRFQKLVRRNQLAFAAGISLAVVLLLGAGVSTWQAVRATQATREESRQRRRAQEAQATAQAKQREAETERERAHAQALKAAANQQHSRRLLYAADMNLVQQTLKLNNLGRARRLLDRHRPQLGEEDLRGWEWRYLWQLTRNSALITLTNRPACGLSVSFSPDGTRLAVGWVDGHMDLWDVPGRRLLRATDREPPQPACVAFSPVGQVLAATSKPNVVALYDLDSGQESILWHAPDQRGWHAKSLSFSPDGSRIVFSAGPIAGERDEQVWVVNVSSAKVEGRHPTAHFGGNPFHGSARLSPSNRHLYLACSDESGFECIDLTTGKQLWRTEQELAGGLTALALSPDGRVVASGLTYSDGTIRVRDAATGRLLVPPLNGHTAYVCELVFTRDGRRLISAAADQTIRFWDTTTWKETQLLRGHTDEVHGLAISEAAQLVATAGKDGDLMLWRDDGKSAPDGYRRLPENLPGNQDLPLDRSRLLLLPAGQPPELIDLKDGSPARSLPELGPSTNVLGWFDPNVLCHWNGSNQILVHELRVAGFILRGTVTASGLRLPAHPPAIGSGSTLQVRRATAGYAYSPTRRLMAWTEWSSSNSVYLAGLGASGNRIELKSDVPELAHFRFSEDGNYLLAWTERKDSPLRVWNVETGQIVASINERVHNAAFAAGGQTLVVDIAQGDDHEIRFYKVTHPDQAPRRVPGRHSSWALAVSPDGELVASASDGGLVRLFDPAKGEWIEDLHGHFTPVSGVAFSPDGRRLITTYGGREAVKLWDVRTRQELLTLGGTGWDLYMARWSPDGDVILVGALWYPWQAWIAPSWDEIAAAEAKEAAAIQPR